MKALKKNLFLSTLLAVIVFCGNAAFLQTPLQGAEEAAPAPLVIPDYYLGVQLGPLPPVLAMHLKLEKEGLLVGTLVPDGPAQKAGLESGDIVLEMSGKKVGTIPDVFSILNEDKDKEQTVLVLRRGDRKELKVKPEKRPEQIAAPRGPSTGMFRTIQPGIIFDGKDSDEARALIRKFIEQMDGLGVDAEYIEGERMMPELPPNLKTERFEVSITPGEKPGTQRIHVQRNNENWDVDKIEDLPKDLQDRVRKMMTPMQENTLGRNLDSWAESASEGWTQLQERMKTEMDAFSKEVEKLSEQAPDLQERFNQYRKSMEDYFNGFWKSQSEKPAK